jgi:hypothetical protein
MAERFFEPRVVELERSGDAELASPRLPGRPAADDADHDIDRLPPLGQRQRIEHLVPLLLVRKIIFQLAAVDLDLPIAGTQADPGDRRLAAAGAEDFSGGWNGGSGCFGGHGMVMESCWVLTGDWKPDA